MSHKISFLALHERIWKSWSGETGDEDWSQQPLETVYQKKPEIKTAIKLPHIAAQPGRSSSNSLALYLPSATLLVLQWSRGQTLVTSTLPLRLFGRDIKRLSQINLCNNFRTQGPPMTLVPDAGMSHFCLILPDSLHCFIHVSKREIQQQALIHRIVAWSPAELKL